MDHWGCLRREQWVWGTPAQVGFNAGDGIRYSSVPGSRTADIVNIETTSSVDVAGVWVFRVDAESIVIGGCTTDPSGNKPIPPPKICTVLDLQLLDLRLYKPCTT